MTSPGRNSRLIVVALAARQPIECLVEQFCMLGGHFRDSIGAAGGAARAHALLVRVTHQHKAGFLVAGEHDRFAACGIGNITNLLIQIACCELLHGYRLQ